MGIPSESAARHRHLSLGTRLGGIFLLLMIIAAGNLYFVDSVYDSVSNAGSVINQSARLRYLSQRLAFQSAEYIRAPDEVVMETEIEADYEFKRQYARVASEIEGLHPLMRGTGSDLKERLKRIDKVWQSLHTALGEMLAGPTLAARQAAQRDVAAHAAAMLDKADQLTDALVKASAVAHHRVDLIVYTVQAAEILMMLLFFFYVRASITAPILKMTDMARRFAAGEWDVHMDFESRDEIGELVQAFNATAGHTAGLIRELDRRARENVTIATILEATTDIVGSATPEGRLLYLNRTGLRTLGVAAGEDIGRYTIADFHPPEIAYHVLHDTLPAAAHEGIWAGENTLRSLSWADIPVSQVIIAHKKEGGAVDYYSTIMRDMTQSKMLEQRLQSSLDFHLKLMQEFPNPIWRVDKIGKCDYVNRAWLEFTGRTLEQELGDGWADGIHPDDRTRCLDTFLSAVARRKPLDRKSVV